MNEWGAVLASWPSAEYSALPRIHRTLRKLAADPEIAGRLLPVRIGLVSTATLDFLLPALEVALFANGIAPQIHTEPYGQVATSLLDPASALAAFRPQVTVAITATAHLPARPALTATRAEVEVLVDDTCLALLEPCEAFHDRTGSELVINTFHSLPGRSAGAVGAKLPGDTTQFLRRLNLAVADRAPRFVHVHDVARLASHRGIDAWFDQRYWYLAKQPVSFDCVIDYARSLGALIAAIMGRTKKCLILDLDNTLWGGVVADDGVAGIHVGEGSGEGEAFKAFQHYVRELQRRGIMLAVCSKNDEAVARAPFIEHPEMVLRLDDFVSFKANWQPKSDNIRAIATELDLPLEAFVFVDDNPAEREQVRQALPEVTVPGMPDDPVGFIRTLDEGRLFDVVSLTAEDATRTEAYRGRSAATRTWTEASNVDAYLESLEMEATIRPFEPVAFERIAQLVNKTNQFNLTTPRVVPAEVEDLAADPLVFARTLRLRDRFTDHGLVSVIVGRIVEDDLIIETWLMSCRVLGRGVERALFNHVLATAQARGVTRITGLYKPTDRNSLVKDHYAHLGFTLTVEPESLSTTTERWQLLVAAEAPTQTFVTINGVRP